ncbi:MAG: T9SS type A sorting domain-containing protein [Candidatus Azobacteroides sp.]|nr:T9SS type A sorting domain-containing protein [Candidatus Azobacteroides sp.]
MTPNKNLIYSIITVGMLLFSQILSAQINLEHTFDGYVMYGNYLTYTSNYYTTMFASTNEVKIYNEDYSLYKAITITPPTNYSTFSISNVSKNFVTTDNKITFLVAFYSSSAEPNLRYAVKLYDENGTIVKDFGYTGSTYSTSFHKTSNNKCRLSILKNIDGAYITDIYSLPGTPPLGVTDQKANEFQSPYPNPANSVITLPYQLKQGEMSVMRIYNLNGQLVETKQIDSVFDKILLNVSGYTKGMYLYDVNGVSNRFIVD